MHWVSLHINWRNTMGDNSRCLVIFTREPQPGGVKRRLVPALGEQGAADVYRRLVLHTLEMARSVDNVRHQVWIDGNIDSAFARQIDTQFQYSCHTQSGDDLGERMYNAFASAFRTCRHCLLIGCDCPQIDCGILMDAFDSLECGNDAVIGPASDGGYYLIGLRRSESTVFDGITWGSDKVAEQTREHFRALGYRWHELPVLSDVDRPEDLFLINASC